LNVSHNLLSGTLFDNDPMPLFDSLEVFDASFNALSSNIPPFKFLISLKVLRLQNNKFSGSIPEALFQETSMVLTELDVSCNQLTGQITLLISVSSYVNIDFSSFLGMQLSMHCVFVILKPTHCNNTHEKKIAY
jgi:Leucine-rich repeat (LRR) protein